VASLPIGNRDKSLLPKAPHAGFPAHHFVIEVRIWKRFSQDAHRATRQAVMHNREMIELVPKTVRGLKCFDPELLQTFFMLSKNKWATSGLQGLPISI